MRVIVVGGGPSGMMSAIASAEKKNEVILIEKMNSLGRKLLITGKGRCNITSSLDMDEFIKNIPGNGKFLYSAFKNYTNLDIINFLRNQGLQTKEERGNRVFPITDKSQDVLNCFMKKLKELNVKIIYNTEIKEILIDEINNTKKVKGVKTNKGIVYNAEKVIIATGGKSYPLTGSTGDGYKMAENIGHHITKIKPSLVPLNILEINICRNLQGLNLRNTKIKILDKENSKTIYEDFGEMIFTHFGISGPIILSSSAHLVRYKDIKEKLKNNKIEILIDLKPALSEEKLDHRILRDFSNLKNKQFKNSLNDLLPHKLIDVIINRSGINPEKRVNEINKNERKDLVKLLKNFNLTIKGFRPIEDAIITSGGIDIKEINPKTMESKLVNNLYFAGEIIDVDGYTGGFNLQIAYSTGYTAGVN